ncbi:MAG TPA: hypothetical protein VGF99_12390 [Myxococcota bacterium]
MLAIALATVLIGDVRTDLADELVLRVRTDPFVTLVAGGASVGVDVAHRDGLTRVSAAAFVVEVPRLLLPLVVRSDVALPALSVVEHAVQFGLMTSLSPQHRGVFVGPELYAYRLRYVDEANPTRAATAYELYAHMTAGFTWFPFDNDDNDKDVDVLGAVFVMPWVTVGLPVFGSGGITFNDGVFVADRLLNFHATVSIGLEL